MTENDGDNKFGWKSAFQAYTFYDILKDSIIPLILSILIIGLQYLSGKDMLKTLQKIISIGLDFIPSMLSILLAAYAILISMYWSSVSEKMKESSHGLSLLKGLNSSFAVAILIICIGMVYFLIIASIGIVQISTEIIGENIIRNINSIVAFLALFFILFSVWIMKDIAINTYNFASFAINLKTKKDKQ